MKPEDLVEDHIHTGDCCNHDHGPHTYQREYPKLGRNDPCFCGSNKKYKKCCLLLTQR